MSEAVRDWIRRRADAVRSRYTAFECLHEHGRGESLVDPDTPVQIFCPFHANVNTPAARYYPALGGRPDYVRCYACRENWDCLGLHMRFRGVQFMDAVRDLERRFGLKIPRRPEGPPIQEPKDKSTPDYESEAWSDVPRVLAVLEKKLRRIRDRSSMHDYVKFCRVLDAVQWDLDASAGVPGQEMVQALKRLREAMDRTEAECSP